ncbi:leader peptidase (prepilin peptidase)/N-methyltransferase [Bacillus ectoiniformans]|uniref:prepilin peptidase n=1 Tax=Bacillus ectoiniformans TaxID=1494429 RepID=UPI00195AD166|nr:A24 family peptidase [Bacillus ectoiniformans]MBM7648940.1 leader peptidase (prepilin peptidase)/N-methyltransferase [Bacillus ectoiniformans]
MTFIVFLYALLFGSFFNVVGMRVPMGQSIVRPRSACPNCGHTLSAMELIPVISYLMQGGKCRVCRTGISPLYPITELSTALLFLYAYLFFGWTLEFGMAVLFISMLIIITVSDLAYMLIPDKILLFFSVFFVIGRMLMPLDPWWDSLLGAASGFLLLLLIALVTNGGMGGGDIKLFAVIGFVMGTKNVFLVFFFACAIGAVIGLFLMFFGIVKRGKPMPFGPFIAIAAIVVLFYGEAMLSWYLAFF